MKIYAVQNFDYLDAHDLIITTEIDEAELVLLENKNHEYVYGSIWENGERIADDLKSFTTNSSDSIKDSMTTILITITKF